ncbi:cupin domain-containing protein [Aestuariimicrobium sp. Y1814]|uniref:cupin domain-containing protein n=1 Tax=Aestuariimicrobium sp. Y1814 TaxID=3418742 RepID=UPI003DA76FBA
MFGAVAARVILGYIPTLLAGVVGLATLFVLDALFGPIRATGRGYAPAQLAPGARIHRRGAAPGGDGADASHRCRTELGASSNVTFEPSCRNNWHIHHGENGGGDQVLNCTAGSGWYQAEGEEPISMTPGTVVRVPAGTKHWHGATAGLWFSHLACITSGTDVSNEWLEPVDDDRYNNLPQNGDNA